MSPARRRIIASLATSADGFIARADGAVDWLDRPAPRGFYGMNAFMRSIDTVVFGRRTWEFGRDHGMPLMPGARNVIVSRTLRASDAPGAEIVRGPIARIAAGLRDGKGKDIWLMGGAQLFGAFLDAGELDALVLHMMPVLIGEGIPLLTPRQRTAELRLVSSTRYRDGVVRLSYEVRAGARKGRRRG